MLNDKVYAVLLRIPANVKGDGKHTIEELVMQKNRDPLRGREHRTPLESIQLGELENLMLKGQGYQMDSIPKMKKSSICVKTLILVQVGTRLM